jgi:hypothetical protein
MTYICDCGQQYSDATGIEACQMNNHGQPFTSSHVSYVPDWKPFGMDPLHGVYWVCGEYPETDCDADEYGETIGWHTGETIKFTALVEIDFEPAHDGEYEVYPVNESITGPFWDNYSISHYAPFEMPNAVGT